MMAGVLFFFFFLLSINISLQTIVIQTLLADNILAIWAPLYILKKSEPGTEPCGASVLCQILLVSQDTNWSILTSQQKIRNVGLTKAGLD